MVSYADPLLFDVDAGVRILLLLISMSFAHARECIPVIPRVCQSTVLTTSSDLSEVRGVVVLFLTLIVLQNTGEN